MTNNNHSVKHKVTLILSLCLLYLMGLAHFSETSKHYSYGDGIEYILITEAWYQSACPAINSKVIKDYISYNDKKHLTVHKRGVVDELKASVQQYELNPKDKAAIKSLKQFGFFQAENGNLYAYHFPFYSLLNVPARIILDHLKADIRLAFLATNLFLMVFALYLILSSNLKRLERFAFSVLLIFSPALWYIDWAHPEVFSGVFSFLAGFYFYKKNYFSSSFCFAIAAMQFQPLAIAAGISGLYGIYLNKLKIKSFLKAGALLIPVFLPAIFYFYHFGTFSLIAKNGFLEPEYLDLKRFFSFFFDINQGMILGLPFILLVLIILLIRDMVKRKIAPYQLLILAVLFMSIFFLQLIYWNHTNSVVNRYVVWNGAILIWVFISQIQSLKRILKYTLLLLAVATQIFAILKQRDFSQVVWYANQHTPLAKYVLEHFPNLYNPDPQIFKWRTSPYMLSSTDSIRVFTNQEDRITKILLPEGKLNHLLKRGIKESTLNNYKENLVPYHDYIYINEEDLIALGYEQKKDTLIDKIEADKRRDLYEDIKSEILINQPWTELIEKQALELNISFEEALHNNIEYTIENNYNKRHE